MNARAAIALTQSTVQPERRRGWAPANCILCPRKRSVIANDRCLELQAIEGCHCASAATRSVRTEVEASDEREALRRHLLAVGRGPRPSAGEERCLLGLHGKKHHGKTTVAEHMVAHHAFSRVRFAAPLKEVIGARLFGMTEAQTDGWLKEAPCVDVVGLEPGVLAEDTIALLFPGRPLPDGTSEPELRDRWCQVYAPLFAGTCRLYSPREIMQVVGGGARTHVATTVWIDLWRTQVAGAGPRVVVDDVRYPNEKDAIEGAGGEVWRLVRTDIPDSGDRDPSETACDQLPDDCFAAVLRRATGVPELLATVDSLLGARRARSLAGAG